jgi:hypothetical protein
LAEQKKHDRSKLLYMESAAWRVRKMNNGKGTG